MTTSAALGAAGTDIYAIPIERGRYLIYGPNHGAFVGNGALVNALASIAAGRYDAREDADGSIRHLASACGIQAEVAAGMARPPRRLHLVLGSDPSVEYSHWRICDVVGSHPAHVPERMAAHVAQAAIDATLDDGEVVAGGQLQLVYHGPLSVLARDLEAVHSDTRSACEARGISLHAHWVGGDVLEENDSEWVIRNVDRATLTGLALPGEAADDQDLGRVGIGAVWSEALRRFDRACFPYRLRLRLRREDFSKLENIVRLLCLNHRPGAIELVPDLEWPESDTPTREGAAFLDAYRGAQRIVRNFHCDLEVAAAAVHERRRFCGVRPDERVVLPDGSSHDCSSGDRGVVAQPSYCNGCFARAHCAGPCPEIERLTDDAWSGDGRCDVIRGVLKEHLLSKIAAAGGLMWTNQVEGMT